MAVIPYLRQCAPPELKATFPDGGHGLAGGVRGVVEAVGSGLAGNLEVYHPRLHHGDAGPGVQAQDAVEPVEGDDDAVLHRKGAPERLVPLPRATKGTP